MWFSSYMWWMNWLSTFSCFSGLRAGWPLWTDGQSRGADEAAQCHHWLRLLTCDSSPVWPSLWRWTRVWMSPCVLSLKAATGQSGSGKEWELFVFSFSGLDFCLLRPGWEKGGWDWRLTLPRYFVAPTAEEMWRVFFRSSDRSSSRLFKLKHHTRRVNGAALDLGEQEDGGTRARTTLKDPPSSSCVRYLLESSQMSSPQFSYCDCTSHIFSHCWSSNPLVLKANSAHFNTVHLVWECDKMYSFERENIFQHQSYKNHKFHDLVTSDDFTAPPF